VVDRAQPGHRTAGAVTLADCLHHVLIQSFMSRPH